MPPERDKPAEVIFEFITLGHTVKASAIDVATGFEVSVVGPASTPPAELQGIALQKLKRRLQREEDRARFKGKNKGPAGGSGGVVA